MANVPAGFDGFEFERTAPFSRNAVIGFGFVAAFSLSVRGSNPGGEPRSPGDRPSRPGFGQKLAYVGRERQSLLSIKSIGMIFRINKATPRNF
jgi:hypothetical protein